MEYGLIGAKLGHSFSREIHASIADYHYELCELSPEGVDALLKNRDFRAINVTIPYKETVFRIWFRFGKRAEDRCGEYDRKQEWEALRR